MCILLKTLITTPQKDRFLLKNNDQRIHIQWRHLWPFIRNNTYQFTILKINKYLQHHQNICKLITHKWMFQRKINKLFKTQIKGQFDALSSHYARNSLRKGPEHNGHSEHMELVFCLGETVWHQRFYVYNLGTGRATRGVSQSVTTWLRVISFSERQPLNAIVSSNSSRIICSTFLIPASPSAANDQMTGRPICRRDHKHHFL